MADVEAHITGTVWKIEVAVGDTVDEGDTVVILESMKMEMPVEAEDAGTVKEISGGGPGGERGRHPVVLEYESISAADGVTRARVGQAGPRPARPRRSRGSTIRNPAKRNALDHEILDAIATAMEELDDGIETRCVIITGSEGMFSAGYDIGDIPDEVFAEEAERLVAHPFSRAIEAVERVPVPDPRGDQRPRARRRPRAGRHCDLRIAARRRQARHAAGQARA